VVGRIRFALERLDSPRHRSHVAQLFSLGVIHIMKLLYGSKIEVKSTDKNFIVITQTEPQRGEIGVHISELEAFIGMLTMAADEATKKS
jgi:hypothetical protein